MLTQPEVTATSGVETVYSTSRFDGFVDDLVKDRPLKLAVIAAPMPSPSSTDATHMTQKIPETPKIPDPSAAAAAPPAITTRLG